MADPLMFGSIGVAIANAVLAAVLVLVYGGTYRTTKAPFVLALLVFGIAFLLQNLLVLYSYVAMMEVVPASMNPYLFGVGVLEAGGLGAMVWTATR